jgi:hypothetical protein
MRVSLAAVCGCIVLEVAAGSHRPDSQQREPQSSSVTIVPVEREPQHRRVFANSAIAVLDVRFPAGYVSLYHTHSNDNVSVRLETGPTRTDTLEATGVEQTAAVGRVVFYSASPPYTHRVANLGGTPIRILDIEILARTPASPAQVPDELDGHEIVVENARVRISRITLAAGQRLGAHTHPRGVLAVSVRGLDGAAFVWRDAGTIAPAIAASTAVRELVEVEVK